MISDIQVHDKLIEEAENYIYSVVRQAIEKGASDDDLEFIAESAAQDWLDDNQSQIIENNMYNTSEYRYSDSQHAKHNKPQHSIYDVYYKNKNIYVEDDVVKTVKPTRKREENYVYLMESQDLTKIGVSKDAHRRLNDLCGMSPVPISLLFYVGPFIKGDAYKVEKYIHTMYAEKRSHGEWFNIDNNDKENIHTELQKCLTKGIPQITKDYRL